MSNADCLKCEGVANLCSSLNARLPNQSQGGHETDK